MRMMAETTLECPRCGSRAVKVYGRGVWFVGGVCMMGISIWFLLIPLLGLVLMPVGFFLGLLLIVLSAMGVVVNHCRTCSKSWRVAPEETE